MVGLKNKKRKSMVGHSQYRAQRMFSGGKIQSRKEAKLPQNFWKLIVYTAAVLFALYYAFLSGKFAIKEVIVQGNSMVPTQDIVKFVDVGQNILLFHTDDKRKEIMSKYKEFKDVQIYKGLPNAIKIVVTEYEGRMIWQTGGKKYLLNPQGKVIREIGSEEKFDLPVVSDAKNVQVLVGQRIVSPSFIAFCSNLMSSFYEITNIKPTEFEITETTFDVNLKTDAGFYIKFDTTRGSTKQLENLKKVLVAKRADVHEYIDLRIDGWAYYK